MKIDEPKLSAILPQSLTSDEKIVAAAQSLDAELKKLSGEIKEVLHLPRLDELNSDVLDHLAWQYHVDNYSADFSEEIKREMIRESIYLHRIKGTKAAVLLALKAFSSNPEISEWFEYAGKEYFFKIVLHDLKDVGDDGETLLRTIFDSKNVRSWLEEILFDFSDGILAERYHAAHELHGGEIFTDLSTYDESTVAEHLHAVIEAEGGEIFTEIELAPEPVSSIFSCGIAELEGGIEFTAADLSDDSPIEEDETDPSDFLKLYFGFPNHSLRNLTMPHPRNNIYPIEIKNLSKFSVNKKILMNSKGLITDGIRRALLIARREEVIL